MSFYPFSKSELPLGFESLTYVEAYELSLKVIGLRKYYYSMGLEEIESAERILSGKKLEKKELIDLLGKIEKEYQRETYYLPRIPDFRVECYLSNNHRYYRCSWYEDKTKCQIYLGSEKVIRDLLGDVNIEKEDRLLKSHILVEALFEKIFKRYWHNHLYPPPVM